MATIRWGLCCMFRDTPIKYASTTVAYIAKLKATGQDPLVYLNNILLRNLNALLETILYCKANGIGSFRINSEFLPIFCHTEHGYRLDQMPDASEIFEKFDLCKKSAAENYIRLTFHPDHFVVLSSPHEHVVQNSLKELEYHGVMAELLGADVINIHAGGAYGNKTTALEQFARNFKKLSSSVQSRLTLENDDTTYTPQDLLPLCQELHIPLVYDAHHHRCLRDELSIEQASDLAYATWNREPLFHISSPMEGWSGPKTYRHHDFIDLNDFPRYWLHYSALTVDIEAKAKEAAVLRIIEELYRS